MTEILRLVPPATNYVHMRNRAYAPGLGRFFQRDMNQTGSALNSIEAYHGAGAFPAVAAMDMQGLYGDGLNGASDSVAHVRVSLGALALALADVPDEACTGSCPPTAVL